jgi:hypothetical protein
VTLLELILVMAILATVVGGGLGMFAALDMGRRQAAGLVKNVLRTAQNSALVRQAPARVRIDQTTGTVRAESLNVIGTWHFESNAARGAFDLHGTVDDACRFVHDGWIGDAISFGGRRGALVRIPVQYDPAYDLTEGFAIDLALRREGDGSGRVLSLGSVVQLDAASDGSLSGSVTPTVQQEGVAQRGGAIVVVSPPGVVAPERWTRVRLSYDRRHLVLTVDGLRVAEAEGSAPLAPVDEDLVLSDERRPFAGSVDALVISSLAADESADLPETVRFGANSPSVIVFDAGGGLDLQVHKEPVLVTLEFEDGTTETIGVGAFGTVE